MQILIALKHSLVHWKNAPVWWVAYSGGLDSSVLLHALVEWSKHETLPPIQGIHINHGLHEQADEWQKHCQNQCDRFGIPLVTIPLNLLHTDSLSTYDVSSLENRARLARYQAFEQTLLEGHLLLMAHHANDQAETLLYRLLRGTGIKGASGIPSVRTLKHATLVRPLLALKRNQLLAYVNSHPMNWVEDPSNQNTSMDRNYLRNRVLPLLNQRWPNFITQWQGFQQHCFESQVLLEELAALDLGHVKTDIHIPWSHSEENKWMVLEVKKLLALTPNRQRNLMRYWLKDKTMLPDTRHWQGWVNLLNAKDDASPVWVLKQGSLLRCQGMVWWVPHDWQVTELHSIHWKNPTHPLTLPNNGILRFEGDAPRDSIDVRYRQGGEVITSLSRGHRSLKQLMNEMKVPQFMRHRVPILYMNNEIINVAGIFSLKNLPYGRLIWQMPQL